MTVSLPAPLPPRPPQWPAIHTPTLIICPTRRPNRRGVISYSPDDFPQPQQEKE